MGEFSTTDAREGFAELLGRVAYGKERVVITKNGKRQAAVIPVEDLDRLEALEKAKGLSALRRLQEGAVKRKLDKMSPEEVEAEIQAARAERRKRKKP
jgi:prevent-host-death family protein